MDEVRATVLRAEVEARLRPVCPDWPEPLFQAVVSQVVEISIKYDRGGELDLEFDPRIAEQLVSDMKALADRATEVRGALPDPPAPPLDS